ncbi:MAG TPA: NAD(P)H-hydrate dehydratase [Candidatus Dormibacteraeota bacterium]|jgi:NAD(P)H-hydrate epimerase|nr:NAD(P)H-hydrate dehydratase [Candidatus Dormibacteraeota bacterium]
MILSSRDGPTPSLNLGKIYPRRPKNARKGDFGRVIIAGGSDRYAGCLAFNALSALRAGADLAIIVAPRRAADIAASYSPDFITVPCDSAFPEPLLVEELLSGADALVLGCGVVRTRSAHQALLKIIKGCSLPIVADAEALHAIAAHPHMFRGKPVLLTPNAGEFQALARRPWPSSERDRVSAVKHLANDYNATVIVKGAEDYVSDGTRVHVDYEGSPYLTKGGYGDLLAGVAGAVMARGTDPFEAASIAAYLVGRAGKMASDKLGEGTLASDALLQLPLALPRSGR